MSAPLLARARHANLALLAAALLLALARGGAAQNAGPVLAGQVVDTAGKPVAGQRVTLHRVDRASGALVDSAVADAQGRFTVHLPAIPAAQDTGAVYFVATRWHDELYIGTPFKQPLPAAATYTVTVGANPVQMGPVGGQATAGGTAPAQGEPPAGPSSTAAARWFLAVMLALVALGAGAYALLRSARERAGQRRRVLLARVAELDEQAAVALPGEAARLREQRAELVSQLMDE